MTVSFDPAGVTFRPDPPRELFTGDFVLRSHDGFFDMPYDASPDGERFLINEPVQPTSDDSEDAQGESIVVVLNWTAELR
jgi:hypothetical protein